MSASSFEWGGAEKVLPLTLAGLIDPAAVDAAEKVEPYACDASTTDLYPAMLAWLESTSNAWARLSMRGTLARS